MDIFKMELDQLLTESSKRDRKCKNHDCLHTKMHNATTLYGRTNKNSN